MKNRVDIWILFSFLALTWACKDGTGGVAEEEALPAPVADTLVGFKGCDKASFTPVTANTFDYKYQNYTVRTTEREDTTGVRITVAPHFGGPHYKVNPPVNSRFFGVNRDFLYIDVNPEDDHGTVRIYDLRGQKAIRQFSYFGDPLIAGDGKFWFFMPADTSEMEEDQYPDCPEKEDWIEKGYHVDYGQQATFNPANRVLVRKSEYRCFQIKE